MDDTEKNSPPADAMPSLSDAIDRIMANPELISMVASALGKPPPAAAGGAKEAHKEEAAAPSSEPSSSNSSNPSNPSDSIAALAPILSSLKGGSAAPRDDRSRLLCALKPYVNPTRREAIDTLLRFSQITDLLKHLN